MSLLSKESENEIKHEVAITVSTFLENYTKPEPRVLGIMNRNQLKNELGISTPTLERFEENGLKVYQPPLQDSRIKFYRVVDVLAFLGIEG